MMSGSAWPSRMKSAISSPITEANLKPCAEHRDPGQVGRRGADEAFVWSVRVHADAGVDHLARHASQVLACEFAQRQQVGVSDLAVDGIRVGAGSLMVNGHLDAAAVRRGKAVTKTAAGELADEDRKVLR